MHLHFSPSSLSTRFFQTLGSLGRRTTCLHLSCDRAFSKDLLPAISAVTTQTGAAALGCMTPNRILKNLLQEKRVQFARNMHCKVLHIPVRALSAAARIHYKVDNPVALVTAARNSLLRTSTVFLILRSWISPGGRRLRMGSREPCLSACASVGGGTMNDPGGGERAVLCSERVWGRGDVRGGVGEG